VISIQFSKSDGDLRHRSPVSSATRTLRAFIRAASSSRMPSLPPRASRHRRSSSTGATLRELLVLAALAALGAVLRCAGRLLARPLSLVPLTRWRQSRQYDVPDEIIGRATAAPPRRSNRMPRVVAACRQSMALQTLPDAPETRGASSHAQVSHSVLTHHATPPTSC
jgi:hypothetical protein